MLAQVTEEVKKGAARAGQIDATLKLKLDEGIIYVDGTGPTPVVDNVDREADCTIITSSETLYKMKSGKLNPMMAVMTGKVKIKGDMGVAMKMQSVFS